MDHDNSPGLLPDETQYLALLDGLTISELCALLEQKEQANCKYDSFAETPTLRHPWEKMTSGAEALKAQCKLLSMIWSSPQKVVHANTRLNTQADAAKGKAETQPECC